MNKQVLMIACVVLLFSCNTKNSSIVESKSFLGAYNYYGVEIPLYEGWIAKKGIDNELLIEGKDISLVIERLSVFLRDDGTIFVDTMVFVEFQSVHKAVWSLRPSTEHMFPLNDSLALYFIVMSDDRQDSTSLYKVMNPIHERIYITDKFKLQAYCDSIYADTYRW